MKSSAYTEKPKNSPSKSSSTKLKNMQKAYGVLPKDLNKLSSSTKSVKSLGAAASDTRTGATTTSQQKLRNSTGGGTSATDIATSTSRKSYPPVGTVKSSSKLVAASKANYAEKYGGIGGTGSPLKENKTRISKDTGGTIMTTNKNQSNISTSGSGSNNNSPYKQKTVSQRTPQKAPSVKSNSTTTSRLTAQKPPSKYYEEEEASEAAYSDEDFEADYESDFEAGESDPENESDPESKNSVVKSVGNESNLDHELEAEYDKSSSIREFEKLEKMVEVEEQRELAGNKTFSGEYRGAGEPAGGKGMTLLMGANESDCDDDEEDDSTVASPPPIVKQNAFPTMTGFSLSTSGPSARENGLGVQQPKRSASNKAITRENSRAKVELKGPGPESGKKKMDRVNRGKIIQGMIKLDRVAVDIFHIAPYQYERFMAVFSGTDRLQASTQTDQDKAEESAQTEPLEVIAKWTQKPPTWSTTSSSCDIRIVRQEALGVGSDDVSEDFNTLDQKIHKQFDFLKNWEQLSKFIIRASRKVLFVLEAEERIKLPSSSGNKGSLETIKMSRGLTVLSKLGMHTLTGDGEFVACANGVPCHDQNSDKITNGNKKHTSKNLISVWSLKEPSMPLYFLRVWGYVSALKLHMIGRMVVSGNRDGSLNVWNLEESLCYHSQYQDRAIRTPSVNTSCMTPTHAQPVIGIEMFSETKTTFSILSIDKEGQLITWSCLRSNDTLNESSLSQHSSAWSTIHISVRHQVQLADITKDHLHITSFFAFWDMDTATIGFYLGTFNGYVAKGQVIVESSNKATATIEKYEERVDTNPKITCVDISRILNILVMGCEDGRCRLFELSRKKLVLSLGGKQEPLQVKWSGRRTSVLYVALKDSLLIWDLLISDMNPWKTIHLKDIRDFVLYSPPHKEYLVVISGKDLIVSTPAEEVRLLSARDMSRIQSYFAFLC